MSYDSFSGKYHRASQPSTGVLLLEMNRLVRPQELRGETDPQAAS